MVENREPQRKPSVQENREAAVEPRFVVETRGDTVLKDLLVQVKRMTELPIGGSDDMGIVLADKHYEDDVVSSVHAVLRPDPRRENYGLRVGFELKERNEMEPQGFIIMSRMPEPSEPENALSLSNIADRMNANTGFAETYELSVRPNGKTYDVVKKGTLEEISANTPIIYKKNGILSVQLEEELTDEGIAAFPQRYEELQKVTSALVEAMYDEANQPLPATPLILEPSKNIARDTKVMAKQLDSAEMQLAASGMIDDSESLQAEVERNIIMEHRPDVTFEDIGGNEEAKEILDTCVDAIRFPELYKKWGTQPPRGVLLYGPPGTGKTLLAKAFANEADADIYSVKTGDVMHSLYGKTERLIQAVFDRARENGPAVILFDELDALAKDRKDSHETTSRIVSVLLQNLDGLEERGANIIVIGTTNRLDAIDPALRRPGRFDVEAPVELPQKEARGDILTIHRAKAENVADRTLFSSDFDLNKITTQTDAFSGAELEEVIRRTLTKKARLESRGENPGLVTTEEVLQEIQKYKAKKAKQNENTGQYL